LESRWEEAIHKQRQTEEEYARFENEQPGQLSEEEKLSIQALSQDIPTLWNAATTSPKDRQTVLRHLIDRVTVEVQGETEVVDITIHWAGGFVSQHDQTRPVARYQQLQDYDRLIARLLELRETGRNSRQIAEVLNGEGFRPPKRRTTYNAAMVRQLLSRHLPKKVRSQQPDPRDPLGEHEWYLTDLAHELEMPETTLHRWLQRGWVESRKLSDRRGRWVLWADNDEIERLRRLRSTKQGWPDRPYPESLTKPKREVRA
jgi:hypothetical protein